MVNISEAYVSTGTASQELIHSRLAWNVMWAIRAFFLEIVTVVTAGLHDCWGSTVVKSEKNYTLLFKNIFRCNFVRSIPVLKRNFLQIFIFSSTSGQTSGSLFRWTPAGISWPITSPSSSPCACPAAGCSWCSSAQSRWGACSRKGRDNRASSWKYRENIFKCFPRLLIKIILPNSIWGLCQLSNIFHEYLSKSDAYDQNHTSKHYMRLSYKLIPIQT